MGFLIGALKVIILLGTLIIIHEFGHFIVAKACKMKVLKFSIGFGPKIFKKQGKETEYSLRLLPLGGFVQLEGEDDISEAETSNDPRAFNNKPAWQRILVLLAGVTINILFALLIYICINMNINTYITTKISNIPNNDFTDLTMLEIGDEIYKINGERVYNNYDVLRIISTADSNNFNFEILSNNGEKENKIVSIPNHEIGYIGTSFVGKQVYSVAPESAGEKAGIKANDTIISINGETKETIDEYLNVIKANPNKEITMLVKRGEEEISLLVVPEATQKRIFDVDFEIVKDLSFGENLHYAVNETAYYLRANFIGLGELLSGHTENVEVQSIVGISKQISSTERAIEFFYMMSAISLSLGIMNLLPIPGLDGGKILFVLIEVIRRKPIKKEVEGMATLAGFGLLILLMIIVTVGDVIKLF